jgi:AcrR family transcriptional regulator
MTETAAPDQPAATARYAARREAILAAAIGILNRQGVKGMTLAGVAAEVGLITTSVTYYFRRKEDLAAACFLGSRVRR